MEPHYQEIRPQGHFQDRPIEADFGRNGWDTFRNDGRGHNFVDSRYQAYILTKAKSYHGDTPSWSRASKQQIPGADTKLAAMGKKYQAATRKGPITHFLELPTKQQAVVNRLRGMIQQEDRDPNAEWVLDYVKPDIQTRHISLWERRRETKSIVVVFRRQDSQYTRSKERLPSGNFDRHQVGDIIDINEPANINVLDVGFDLGHDVHSRGRRNTFSEYNRPRDGLRDQHQQFQDPFQQHGHHQQGHNQHGHHQQGHHQQPWDDHMHGAVQGHDVQYDQMGGHDGIAVMDQQGDFHDFADGQPKKKGKKGKKNKKGMQDQGAFDNNGAFEDPINGGPAPFDGNPFQPDLQFNHPGAFEMPGGMSHHDQRYNARSFTPGHDRSHSRSRSRRREAEEEARRERERLERKVENLEDQVKLNERLNMNEAKLNERININERLNDVRLHEVLNKVDNWHLRDNYRDSSSSDRSPRDNDGFWSAPPSGGSFTPPSTPPLSAALEPRGTLNRRKSYHRRDSRGYHGQRYKRDGRMVIEPHRNSQRRIDYRDDRRRSDSLGRGPLPVAPEARHYTRREQRPVLHHAHTYDDYPTGRGAEYPPDFPLDDFDYADYGRGRQYERRGGRRGAVFDERRGRSRKDSVLW